MISWLEKHLTPCFFKSTFGIDCPGCGMQRAFISLLKGNLTESVRYHPALIPFLITLLILLIQLKVKHPKGGTLVMWMFIATSIITMLNYGIRQYLLYSR